MQVPATEVCVVNVKVVGTVCPKADPQYATLAWVENLKKELNQLAHAPSVQVVGRSHWPIKVLVTCVCQVRELFIIHVGCTLFITFSTDQNKKYTCLYNFRTRSNTSVFFFYFVVMLLLALPLRSILQHFPISFDFQDKHKMRSVPSPAMFAPPASIPQYRRNKVVLIANRENTRMKLVVQVAFLAS